MIRSADDIENAWRKAMVLQLLSHRKERKVEYVSLESMVAPYLSKPFDSLPANVAARVREAFEPLFHWDNFGEQRRLQIVQEHDYKNDPAMNPVRAHYWKLVGSIQETEKKIRELELLPATKPSERRIKEQDLSVLHGELAVLEAQSNAPYTEPTVADTATTAPQAETKEERQDRRLLACETAGLVMPISSVGRLPYGVGKIADAEGVTRQTLSTDIKAALERRKANKREGTTVHRT
jgi:hypothetical protein